jgi:outer membrane protein insertion porin family
MGRELAGGFDVYHITSNYRQEASFQERNSGFVLRSGFKLAEDLNLSPRYRLNADEVTNLTDNVSAVVRDSANRGQLIGSSLGYELSYDKRDDFINPTAGYVLQLNQDASGLGGDVKAVKSIATAKYFYTPITDFTFAWGLEGGAVVPLSGYDLRIIDRNLLGGQSFRGFDVAGLGPRFIPAPGTNFNNDAVGGQYFTVLHSELGFPLPGLDDLGMAGVLFNDTGSLWGVGNKPNLGTQGTIKDDTALRSSVGFGLKWRSPVGPIRLDFSHPFLKKKYDQTQLFLFSAGSSF